MKHIGFISIIFLSQLLAAAPHPGTSSSFLLGIEKGRFISKHGFLINSSDTGWIHKSTPRGIENIETIYASPEESDGLQASLTVRVDDLSDISSASQYMKKWMNDYPRFGFDILASRKVKVNGNIAQMVDLIHAESERQLRQVIFVKNQKAVIFTCRDSKMTFLKAMKSCNEIVRSFRWTI